MKTVLIIEDDEEIIKIIDQHGNSANLHVPHARPVLLDCLWRRLATVPGQAT